MFFDQNEPAHEHDGWHGHVRHGHHKRHGQLCRHVRFRRRAHEITFQYACRQPCFRWYVWCNCPSKTWKKGKCDSIIPQIVAEIWVLSTGTRNQASEDPCKGTSCKDPCMVILGYNVSNVLAISLCKDHWALRTLIVQRYLRTPQYFT